MTEIKTVGLITLCFLVLLIASREPIKKEIQVKERPKFGYNYGVRINE